MQVRSRVKLVGEGNSVIMGGIQERQPASCQVLKSHLYQSCWTLRPGIHRVPEQCSRKDRHHAQTEIVRCLYDLDDLPSRPLGTCLGMIMQGLRSKGIEHDIISGMNRHQLSQQMSRQFSDDQPIASPFEVIAVLL